MPSGKYLKTWQLVAIILAGTVVRFVYGYFSKVWLGSPDQLAWGLSIDEMLNSKTWSYLQLVHAPHEGGSFFIGLLSILFRPLGMLPPLSWAALLIDTAGRLLQIKITQRLLGDKTAVWFGIWTILSVPLLVPWTIVNFGLHALLSFVPFVFIAVVNRYKENKYLPFVCGIVCGIVVSLSYDSLILLMASILFLVWIGKDVKAAVLNILLLLVSFSITMLPHIAARSWIDTGFSLNGGQSPLSIRGLFLGDLFTAQHFIHFTTAWISSLPGSFLLSSTGFLSPLAICAVVCLFLFCGLFFYFSGTKVNRQARFLSACIVILFMAAYTFSPFYGKGYSNTHYVYYRHLCYILPLLVMMMINGFMQMGKWKMYVITGWLLLCGIASVQYIGSVKKIEQPVYRQAGWVLAKKYGGDASKLLQIRSMAETAYQDELLTGFGWGMSATVLDKKKDTASAEKLVQLIREYPASYQPAIIEGVHYSFAKKVTPVLDSTLPSIIDARLLSLQENHKP